MMNFIQQRIQSLHSVTANLTAEPDFDRFWKRVAEEAGNHASYTITEESSPFQNEPVYRLVYEGAANTSIHAWYMHPNRKQPSDKPFPCIVFIHGYHGSKGSPEDHAAWLMMGYAVIAIDVRGQMGDTGNNMPQEFGMVKGWMTQGILDPETSYYRAITIDALRAIHIAMELPEIDSERVFVVGASQGGGLALVVSAFEPRLKAAVAHVPNMCYMDYSILNSTGSITEAATLVTSKPERLPDVLRTLSYFDVMNMADRITIPVRLSVGLKDLICMPESIFAAYNRIASIDKDIEVHPFMGHSTPPGYRQTAHAFFAGLK